jgi:lipid-A-disaccharide synthase
MPELLDAVDRINHQQASSFVWAVPLGLKIHTFRERIGRSPIKVIEGETWDSIAHADLALAASGTVTMEAALLGTPLVTFYRVTALSWLVGRRLVRVPFLSMVNLVAGRKIVPELMQNEMRGEILAAEALRLLLDPAARERMRRDLADVASMVSTPTDPLDRAAAIVYQEFLRKRT